MRLVHTKPCAECPWRLNAPQGWLGGYEAEWYADVVQDNEIPACHRQDHGPEDPGTAYCAGALSTASNACIQPLDEPAREARRLVGRNPGCFPHPREFYRYHSRGLEYVPRILRPAAV